jgi:hypothetical protein
MPWLVCFLLVEEDGVVLVLHLLRRFVKQCVFASVSAANFLLVVATCTLAEPPNVCLGALLLI